MVFFFFRKIQLLPIKACLNITGSGSNVQSIVVSSQSNKSLLGTVGSDQGVNLEDLNVKQLLNSLLDLVLVGLDVNSENKSVRVLNLLDSRLRVEMADNNLVLVESRVVSDSLSGVTGVSSKLQGLGESEAGRSSNLLNLLGVNTLDDGLLSVQSFLVRRSHCCVLLLIDGLVKEKDVSLCDVEALLSG